MVTYAEESDLQPVPVSVKMNLAIPGAILVTKPAAFTVAMLLLEETHVPPDEGESCVVFPRQMVVGPAYETEGLPSMTT